MSNVLAVDIGRTGCRAAIWDDAAVAPRATAAGAGSIGLGADHGARIAEAAILAVVKPLLAAEHPDGVDFLGVGIAGAMGAPAAAEELARRLATSLAVRSVTVTSDAISSHAGALGNAAGVVLALGTGAVALAIGTAARFRRVDGLGPWLGDEGSGAWIGRRGLQAVARASDGRGPATSMSAAMERQFGSLDSLAARLGSEPNPARSMASFAPAVAAAARAGDAAAIAILGAAASALAGSMRAAAAALDAATPVAASIVGGLMDMGPILLDPLHAAIANQPGIQLRPALGTSLDGARHLATTEAGIHTPWVTRVSG